MNTNYVTALEFVKCLLSLHGIEYSNKQNKRIKKYPRNMIGRFARVFVLYEYFDFIASLAMYCSLGKSTW